MEKAKNKIMAIVSFVLSLISFFGLIFISVNTKMLNISPWANFFLIFPILSLIFGLIVLYKNKNGKKWALAGIIICLSILILEVNILAGTLESVLWENFRLS